MNFIGVIILTSLYGGFVLKLLWSWFVSPTFNLPGLNIPQAIGLSVVMACFIPTGMPDKDKKVDHWELLLVSGLKHSVLLIMGWIVKQFL